MDASIPQRTAWTGGGPLGLASDRIVAVDLARWVAIVGMMSAHLLASTAASWGGSGAEALPADVVMGAANGNASMAFAVLAGVGMVLSTRGMLAERRRAAALRSIAGRAAVLLVAGFLLTTLAPPVYVVLQFLGWGMLLAAPLLLLPSWAIVAIASVLWLVGGTIATAVSTWRFDTVVALEGTGYDMPVDRLADSPVALLADLTLTGRYPGVTWVVLIAAGIVVGRLLLTRAARSTREAAAGTRDANAQAARASMRGMRMLGLSLVGVGALLATIGAVALRVALGVMGEAWALASGASIAWQDPPVVGDGSAPGPQLWWQLADVPHTGTVADVARGLGVALAVLGLLLALLPTGASMPRWVRPLRAAGGAALTIYVGHVVLLAIANVVWWATLDVAGDVEAPWFVSGFAMLGLHVAASIAVGWLLARTGTRGPLERAASAAARWAAGGGRPDPDPAVRA